MPLSINACPEFWKDVKALRKNLSPQLSECSLDADSFHEADDALKASSIAIIDKVTNFIINSHDQGIIEAQTFKNGTQPFLTQGWTVRKVRYAVDGKGKSGGLRVMFCLDGAALVLIHMTKKKDGENEASIQKETTARFRKYISL
jgi:hypothetical protein